MQEQEVPARVDFAGGWLDLPKFARGGAFIVNCAITPGFVHGQESYPPGAGLGGSAAIASHVVIDLNKAAGVRAVALNDPAALTCLANDLSYQEVFATQIAWHGRPGDVLVAISSSGKSINILQAVEAARAARMRVVTFSGFRGDNPLRLSGDLNFYVPSDRYGFVELAHQILLHAVTDALGAERAKPAEAAE